MAGEGRRVQQSEEGHGDGDRPGETYGLLGPNGAGKTTTIRLVCGLLRPDRGGCLIAGRPVGTSRVGAKELVGYVPQEVALYLAMLGGCMWPLEIVPPTVRAIGHVTPHAWAVDAWITVLSKGGPLGVLALFAIGLLVADSYRLIA